MRLLHTADLHIGFKSHSRIDSTTGLSSRLGDIERTLSEILSVAKNYEVDAVLIVGDIFHTHSPSPEAENIFASFIVGLGDANIPVVVVLGNHEIFSRIGRAHPLKAFITLREKGFTVFDSPDIAEIKTPSGKLAVAAIPYPSLLSMNDRNAASPEFWDKFYRETVNSLAKRLPDEVPAVLTAHITIAGADMNRSSGVEPVIRRSALLHDRFSYVALGHLHRFQSLAISTPMVYAGSVERISFNEENDPKGVVIVDIPETAAQGKSKYHFVELKSPRKLITVRCDLRNSQSPLNDMEVTLRSRNTRNAIVRVIYLQHSSQSPISSRTIRAMLPDAFIVEVIREIADEKNESMTIRQGWEPLKTLSEYINSVEKYAAERNAIIQLARKFMEERDSHRRTENDGPR